MVSQIINLNNCNVLWKIELSWKYKYNMYMLYKLAFMILYITSSLTIISVIELIFHIMKCNDFCKLSNIKWSNKILFFNTHLYQIQKLLSHKLTILSKNFLFPYSIIFCHIWYHLNCSQTTKNSFKMPVKIYFDKVLFTFLSYFIFLFINCGSFTIISLYCKILALTKVQLFIFLFIETPTQILKIINYILFTNILL